jgi:uncharacterized protein YjiK
MTCQHHQLFSKYLSFTVVFILAGLGSCTSPKEYASPPGYDLNKPYRYSLPSVLDEISGILYYPKDSCLFAIQDEKGFLFKIHLGAPVRIEKWKFSSAGDYEDLALVDSNFFVLKSKGVLEKFKFFTGDSMSLQSFRFSEGGKNEFETLYYDSSVHQLIIICKSCEADKKKQVSSWLFDPVTDSVKTFFVINTENIKEQLNEDKLKLKPSAAAINPLTGELFVVCSVNKLLVVLDNKNHAVKNVYELDPKLFKQPEGLTFTPGGDLLISNESSNQGAADILVFKYNKPNTRQ